jgi:hypothetical protein
MHCLLIIWYVISRLLIIVAARSKAWNFFARLNAGIVGSNTRRYYEINSVLLICSTVTAIKVTHMLFGWFLYAVRIPIIKFLIIIHGNMYIFSVTYKFIGLYNCIYPRGIIFFIHVFLGSQSALLFWKLLLFEFLLGISETFLCSMSALQVKVATLSRCASAAVVCRDVDVFGTKILLLII